MAFRSPCPNCGYENMNHRTYCKNCSVHLSQARSVFREAGRRMEFLREQERAAIRDSGLRMEDLRYEAEERATSRSWATIFAGIFGGLLVVSFALTSVISLFSPSTYDEPILSVMQDDSSLQEWAEANNETRTQTALELVAERMIDGSALDDDFMFDDLRVSATKLIDCMDNLALVYNLEDEVKSVSWAADVCVDYNDVLN